MNENNADQFDKTTLAAEIVAAFVSHNSVPTGDLPDLIRSVHATLQNLGAPKAEEPQILAPAVPIKKSITPDFIICLEDGKKFKSLKRHLRTKYEMTPDQYRTKWGLPSDYPMVAPNYASARSELAKAMGLGAARRGTAVLKSAPAPEVDNAADEAPKRKARPKKAA
jgi:predicted transcriptional regulator